MPDQCRILYKINKLLPHLNHLKLQMLLNQKYLKLILSRQQILLQLFIKFAKSEALKLNL